MILHCTRKLAERLPDVSIARLTETGQLGSWHAHLYSIDRRQCLFFCHDETRYCLILPGVRAPQLKELGRWHRDLFLAALASAGAETAALKRIELALGPARSDTTTDRSVLSSMTVARWDMEGSLARVAHVLDLDPIGVSRRLNQRPARVGRALHWPEREMLERVAAL